jgi:hypothetical protein
MVRRRVRRNPLVEDFRWRRQPNKNGNRSERVEILLIEHRSSADANDRRRLLHYFSNRLRLSSAKTGFTLGCEYLGDRPACSLGDQLIGIDALTAE